MILRNAIGHNAALALAKQLEQTPQENSRRNGSLVTLFYRLCGILQSLSHADIISFTT